MEIDSNGDAIFDKFQFYQNGRLTRIESDRNFDGPRVDSQHGPEHGRSGCGAADRSLPAAAGESVQGQAALELTIMLERT